MTKSYFFAGKVLPEREATDINMHFGSLAEEKESGLKFDIQVSIVKSQISAIVNTETTDILTLRNYVDQVIRIFVDIHGYLSGCGFDIEITSVTDENSAHTVFGVDITRFAGNPKDYNVNFDRFVKIAEMSPYLRLALSNLRDAIKRPSDTGFHSYRAIESVRQEFMDSIGETETKEEREKSWKKMNDSLQIEKKFSAYLTKYANPQRHGGFKSMDEAERIDVMERARKIVDRFCAYLEGNRQPLDERKYPKLA